MPAATVTKQPPLAVDLETAPPVSGLPAPAQPSAADMLSMIERLASNPDVDVTKLEKIIDLKERVMAHDAKSAFDAAYARMQPEIPAIDEKGRITVKDQVRSRYAKLEDIQRAVKPVLAQFGFALRHRTEWPQDRKVIRIVGILAHEFGHSEESVFEAPADKSDFRTDIQSQGSTVSYGRRYTTIDLLNIETRGMDDDGRKSGRPEPPAGYDDFALALSKEAEKGLDAVQRMFSAASEDYRKYLTQHDADAYKKIRERARTGKAATS
jgi:hypothetical protein